MSSGIASISIEDLQGAPGRHRRESVIRKLFVSSAILSIVISASIVAVLLVEAMTFLRSVDLSALWSSGWFPRQGKFDLRTIIAGTLLITAIAMLVAAPLGLGAAIYLSEYAKPRVRRWLKPVLEILAGIPSVVIGFFALTWISPTIVQRLASDSAGFNMAAAGIGVGILVTPLVASVAEDGMRAVPSALREASAGLGARKRTTTLRVVVPAAISAIAAGLIVGISRAIGETMVVAIAAGGTGGSAFTLDPFQPGQTMTAAMTALATGSDQVKGVEGTFQSLFFVGLLLFVMTLVLNLLSEKIVRRVRQRY